LEQERYIVAHQNKNVVEVDGLWKKFGDKDVVREVSFSLGPGQIMALIGPNGAGKTTTIRMILDIIRPDKGSITVLGRRMSEEVKSHIGYLPEERGLYKNLRIIPTLEYLAVLKGMTRQDANRRALQLLDRLGMTQHKDKKIGELSRGMAQLIQFAGTIVHNPSLVILDEPFASLDPVNTQLIKDVIAEQRQQGVAVIMCTHQMHQVEETCDRVVMINQGTLVLNGLLHDIKRQYRSDNLEIECEPWPDNVPGVSVLQNRDHAKVVKMNPGATTEKVLHSLLEMGCHISRFEVQTPSMEEIFVTVVKARNE